MTEFWKPIEEWEGLYEISSFGKVKSLARKFSPQETIMKIGLNTRKYQIVHLSVGGRYETKTVHRLVAQAFIDNPDNKPEVNHKDLNKENNFIENLEWNTRLENNQHALNNNANPNCTQREINQYDKLGKFLKRFKYLSLISTEYAHLYANKRAATNSICDALNGRSKTSGGFRWKYAT